MNFKTSIPFNENEEVKRKTSGPIHGNLQDSFRGKEHLCFPPSGVPPSASAEPLFSFFLLKWAANSMQVFYLLPSRWSHPQRPIGPGKETGSHTSTGKAADGSVKNIPCERQHPLCHRIIERGVLLLAIPHQPPAQTIGKGKTLPKVRTAGKSCKALLRSWLCALSNMLQGTPAQQGGKSVTALQNHPKRYLASPFKSPLFNIPASMKQLLLMKLRDMPERNILHPHLFPNGFAVWKVTYGSKAKPWGT